MRSLISPQMISVAAGLADVRARIASAAVSAKRDPGDVTLVAVSKTHPAEAVAAAVAAGQVVFGENRLQEAEQKFLSVLADNPAVRLHIIGALQTNKAAAAVRLAHMIETLDRSKLADAIARAADAMGKCPMLLVQINIGDEPQKAGISVGEAEGFIREMRLRFGGSLQGLMCIPPANIDPAPYFERLAAMADQHGLPIRSMGMSSDFEIAIAAGATHVRVGSAIFGNRA